MEFLQKCVCSHRFDPSFDLSSRTPSSAAATPPPHLARLPPPSSHRVTLILFLPFSCYLVPSHPLFGPNSESAAAASLIKPVNGRHYEICNTPFTEDYWGGSSFTEAGRAGEEARPLCLNDGCTCNSGRLHLEGGVSLYQRACRCLVLHDFYSAKLHNGGH